MGCTQSKASTNAIVGGESHSLHQVNPVKGSSSAAPSKLLESSASADVTLTNTTSAEDHVIVTKANVNAATSTFVTIPAMPEPETEGPFDEPKEATKTSPQVQMIPVSPARSPRRQRRRSNSSGVKEMSQVMLMMDQDDDSKEQQAQLPVEVMLQPVKKVEEAAAAEMEPKSVIVSDKESESIETKTTAATKEEILPADVKTCAGCSIAESNSGDFKFCAKCRVVSYCGKECQKKHWKEHKHVCNSNVSKAAMEETEASLSQLLSSWSISQSSSNTSSSTTNKNDHENVEKDTEVVVATEERKTSIHEEAVQELEACLARLRSDESSESNPSDEDDGKNNSDDSEYSPNNKEPTEESDPVEEARAAATIADEVAAALDQNENVAPSSSNENKRPFIPQPKVQIMQCAGCDAIEKAPSTFKPCAKCRDVVYCNKKCQKAHFKQHKKTCCKMDTSKRSLQEKTKNTATVNPI